MLEHFLLYTVIPITNNRRQILLEIFNNLINTEKQDEFAEKLIFLLCGVNAVYEDTFLNIERGIQSLVKHVQKSDHIN